MPNEHALASMPPSLCDKPIPNHGITTPFDSLQPLPFIRGTARIHQEIGALGLELDAWRRGADGLLL